MRETLSEKFRKKSNNISVKEKGCSYCRYRIIKGECPNCGVKQ